MALFQSIIDFLQEIFMPAAPEVKKRIALKKLETDMRNFTPAIYRNDMLLPNFAEALRVLYVNTKPVMSLLSNTICSDDLERNHHFLEQLMMTGFSDEAQNIIESLEYQNRKESAENDTSNSLTRHFEMEHVRLEKVVAELKTPAFAQFDKVMDSIKQLNDICRYNFITPLRLFDKNFVESPAYTALFQAVPLELIENTLQDLYYVSAGLDISSSTGNAIRALQILQRRGHADQEEALALESCLRKILGALKSVLREDVMLNLLRLAKGDPEYKPSKATYSSQERLKFGEYLENRFIIDEGRLKNELQEETVTNEVNSLFSGKNVEKVAGYNNEINNLLKQSTPCSFFWVLPMQVLKGFVSIYYEPKVKQFLNDIVIEGFFNATDYKSEYAADVYAVNDAMAHVKAFEQMFGHGSPYDENMIVGLIKDSHKDASFLTRLKTVVDRIDKEAKGIIQNQVINIARLYDKVNEILVETKKPMSDVISNVKVLAMSSRNRDNFEFLDTTIHQWKLFLDIMGDYVSIKKGDGKK